ncbi:hypothetical protein HYFRA_00000839 [Hymenoscyphus fraxineus]|uniref:Uncharacterized protein n=1 Tax=Hymenoscyphus fraxineus TaxID=746836 RepID=A0A9N9PM98_9HELO|nr:hypothetical protein HYFRA_00000839 [Hymenoscyphus fraxineus]
MSETKIGKEAQLFFAILNNMKDSKLTKDVDWEKVAAEANYKTGSCAKVRWGQIRRDREKKAGDGETSESPKATKTKDAAKAPKAKTPKADTKSKVAKAPKAPTGKGKKAVAKGKVAKKEDVDEDEFADAPEEADDDIAAGEDDEVKDEQK